MSVPHLSRSFSELAEQGFAPEIVDRWTAAFPDGLNPLQLKAVNEYGVLEGGSLLVVAPTSSGKTLIGELAAIQAVIARATAYKTIVPSISYCDSHH